MHITLPESNQVQQNTIDDIDKFLDFEDRKNLNIDLDIDLYDSPSVTKKVQIHPSTLLKKSKKIQKKPKENSISTRTNLFQIEIRLPVARILQLSPSIKHLQARKQQNNKPKKKEARKPYPTIVKELMQRFDIKNEADLRRVAAKGVKLKKKLSYYNLQGNYVIYSRLQGELRRQLDNSCNYNSRSDNKKMVQFLVENVARDGKFNYSEAKLMGLEQGDRQILNISRRTCHRHVSGMKGKKLEFRTSLKKDVYQCYKENKKYQKNIVFDPLCQKPLFQLKLKDSEQVVDRVTGVKKERRGKKKKLLGKEQMKL